MVGDPRDTVNCTHCRRVFVACAFHDLYRLAGSAQTRRVGATQSHNQISASHQTLFSISKSRTPALSHRFPARKPLPRLCWPTVQCKLVFTIMACTSGCWPWRRLIMLPVPLLVRACYEEAADDPIHHHLVYNIRPVRHGLLTRCYVSPHRQKCTVRIVFRDVHIAAFPRFNHESLLKSGRRCSQLLFVVGR